ncbi:hypothetical protein PIB30_064397 [Stylosanthes scabra]|uniref:Secreted protein n=1 Tax=Stylosanthes scabra TaxID=79078 RepID=A0ABU6TLI6_9FABA|nr:hypothetical protein [Stylosanthes scabra]
MKRGRSLATRKIPAATIVAACIRAEIGVGFLNRVIFRHFLLVFRFSLDALVRHRLDHHLPLAVPSPKSPVSSPSAAARAFMHCLKTLPSSLSYRHEFNEPGFVAGNLCTRLRKTAVRSALLPLQNLQGPLDQRA